MARRFLAHAVALAESEPARKATAYLHAAWVCDDFRNSDGADDCRRRAAEWFSRCKPFPDTEPGLTTGAVLVDVLRRCGQFDAALAEATELLCILQRPPSKGS